MKIHLVKKHRIEQFEKNNARSRSSFRLWQLVLKEADWNCPQDMLETFGSADILGNGSNQIVFDIGGNNYRVICHYVFGDTQVHLFICWIGAHAEYSELCRDKKQYSINEY